MKKIFVVASLILLCCASLSLAQAKFPVRDITNTVVWQQAVEPMLQPNSFWGNGKDMEGEH